MKSILTHELSLLPSSGAGSAFVSPVKPGYIEKIILKIETGVTVDVSISISSLDSLYGDDVVYAKGSLAAGTYHLYPRAPTVKADGTALTTLPYVKPLFHLGDKLTLTLANATVDTKRITAFIRYSPVEPGSC